MKKTLIVLFAAISVFSWTTENDTMAAKYVGKFDTATVRAKKLVIKKAIHATSGSDSILILKKDTIEYRTKTEMVADLAGLINDSLRFVDSARIAGTTPHADSSDKGRPTSAAGGDLSGQYPNPGVAKIKGNTIPANASGLLRNNGYGILTWKDSAATAHSSDITFALVGTDNYLLKKNGTATANSQIYDNGTLVSFGVGASPAYKYTFKGQGKEPWIAAERNGSTSIQFKLVNAEGTGYNASTGTVSPLWTNCIDGMNSNIMLSSVNSGGTGGNILLDALYIKTVGASTIYAYCIGLARTAGAMLFDSAGIALSLSGASGGKAIIINADSTVLFNKSISIRGAAEGIDFARGSGEANYGRIKFDSTTGNGRYRLQIENSSGTGEIRINQSASSGAKGVTFYSAGNTSSTPDAYVLKNRLTVAKSISTDTGIFNNLLGVGVAPSYPLDVRSSIATANIQSTTTGNRSITRYYNNNGQTFVGVEGTGGQIATGTAAGASVIASYGSSPIQLCVNDGVKVTITSSGDIYSDSLINWTASANPVGWSSVTGNIWYYKLGRRIDLEFYLTGPSNDINTSFTIPYSSRSDLAQFGSVWGTNGTTTSPCETDIEGGTNYINIFWCGWVGGGNNQWAATGTKVIHGHVTYFCQ
jgi:hypothetical protein